MKELHIEWRHVMTPGAGAHEHRMIANVEQHPTIGDGVRPIPTAARTKSRNTKSRALRPVERTVSIASNVRGARRDGREIGAPPVLLESCGPVARLATERGCFGEQRVRCQESPDAMGVSLSGRQ